MANTVSILSYANTFGDWVVSTNALAKENNDIAANNYTKPTGTLYLNSSTLGLQVAANAIVQGQLQVTGTSSSATIQNNLTVTTGNVIVTAGNVVVSTGNVAITSGNLGVGTNTPAYKADINGTLRANSIIFGVANTLTVTGNYTINQSVASGASPTFTGSNFTGVPAAGVTGLAASATTDTTVATNITSGTLNVLRLPTIPSTQISGLAASATTDTTNANNISTGTLAAARLPYTINQNLGTTNSPTFAGATINGLVSGTGGMYSTSLLLSGTYTLGSNSLGTLVQFSGGPYTVTLPNPSSCNGGVIHVFLNPTTTTTQITIATPSGNIYGPTGNNTTSQSITYAATGASYILYCDGSNWLLTAIPTLNSVGNMYVGGDITAYNSSDERLKDNIQVIPDALDKLCQLDGVTFNWNDKAFDKDIYAREAGIIAQQVQKVLPEVVTERDTGYLAVKYERLVPLLIEAIKELRAEVADLKIKIGE